MKEEGMKMRDCCCCCYSEEDVIPESCFSVCFDFGEIVVDSAAFLLQSDSEVMVEVDREIEDRRGDGFSINDEVMFIEMPASRTHEEDSVGLRVQLVDFSALRFILESECFRIQLNERILRGELVAPCWCERVFKVCHEDICAGIHGVDAHFRGWWSSDFNPTTLDIRRDWRDLPRAVVADILRLGWEGQATSIR